MPYPRAKPPAGGIKTNYPGFIEPSLATSIDKVPAGERWILAADRFDAAYIWSTAISFPNREQIAKVALQHRVPTISDFADYARQGLLLTYGQDAGSFFGDAAEYIDKLLQGTKPADLPLQQPTKFDLVINLKTAKALGIAIPPSFLIRADDVIE
jgi:putative ABC transport system substrate-binding protein